MPGGGTRKGAGRPAGIGKYGEKTKPIRVPESLIDKVLEYVASKAYELPLYSSTVSAGFPSPADEHVETPLDLNKYLIKNPPATFFVRASGESMTGVGIFSGDILVVDRSLEAKSGKIVIAAIDGHLTVKRLYKVANKMILKSENKNHADIVVEEGSEVVIWGVVTSVIHKL